MNEIREENWWGRNWKWVVPVGCFGVVTLIVGFALVIIFVVFGFIKSSDAYTGAVSRAKAHPAVKAALGTPIEEGLLVTGNINVSGASGTANLAATLSGPKGEGTLYIVATKTAGTWTYSTLVFEITKTKQKIDLLVPQGGQSGFSGCWISVFQQWRQYTHVREESVDSGIAA